MGEFYKNLWIINLHSTIINCCNQITVEELLIALKQCKNKET
jgi:hypothetical protein